MAWNTHRLQAMIDRAPNTYPDAVLSRLAPIGHKHINMRGILTFELAGYGSRLLHQPPPSGENRASILFHFGDTKYICHINYEYYGNFRNMELFSVSGTDCWS